MIRVRLLHSGNRLRTRLGRRESDVRETFILANCGLMPRLVENVCQFLRDNWLSNRIFRFYDDILDLCRAAWNTLIDQPWKITSVGCRNWAHAS